MRNRMGFTLVELLVAIAIIGVLIGLIVSAVQRVRVSTAKAQCTNNLKQIGLALQNYHDLHGTFPPGLRTERDPYLFLSWQARLMPQLEQQPIWDETVREYARDSRFWVAPRHASLRRPMPILVCPLDGRMTGIAVVDGVDLAGYEVGFTHYLGVSGSGQYPEDGVLTLNAVVRIGEIRDGTSQTIAVGERPPSPDSCWGWWYAGAGQDLTGSADMILSAVTTRTTYRTPTCPPGPYHYGPGRSDNLCDIYHFWSLHPGGAHFLFADGSVHFLRYEIGDGLMALASRAGGEVTVPIE